MRCECLNFSTISLSRLLNDDIKNDDDIELRCIYQIWYESIQFLDGQNKLKYYMAKILKQRMKQHQAFFDKILVELDQVSESHANAFRYWMSLGNLVHVNPANDSYPNVTLTCQNPMFDLGKNV